MITTNLYIPTNSVSLAFYFESGLILPHAYIRNSRSQQGVFDGRSIIISKDKWIENSNCSIEIILSEDEKKSLKPVGNSFYLYPLPLPITRIVQIHFLETEKMETAVWNVNIGTAFIPRRLISVDETLPTPSKLDPKIRETSERSDSISSLIKRFNVLLGGFAFMKLAAPPGSNFPYNYFATFSLFNKIIEEDVRAAEKKYSLYFDRKYSGLFTTKNQEIWSNWTSYIYGEVLPTDIQQLAAANNILINKKLGNIQLDSISSDTILFDIALLATYGNNKSKSVEDLLSFLYNSQLSEEKVEEITLLFGLHLGYSSLRNSYKYGPEERKIKFELKSRLDYYIIESIYQYVFKQGKQNRSFDFLESIIPVHDVESRGNLYYILDHPIFFKKKEDGGGAFLEGLENKFWNDIASLNKDISIPGFSYDFNSSREFYVKNGGPALKLLLSTIAGHYKKAAAPSVENASRSQNKQPEIKIGESNPVNNTITLHQSEFSDEYNSLSLTDLKSIAKSKGIKNLSNYKATQKDLAALISLIRGVRDIL